MATIQEIKSAIMFGDLSNDDLASIIDAIKYRRAQVGKQNARSFVVGARVKFTHPKTGRVHIGEVKKVKIKNITVLENGFTNWNVPANMLEAV